MSAMPESPDFEQVADALDFFDVEQEASEVHGLMSGYVCAGVDINADNCCEVLFEMPPANPDDITVLENQAVLSSLLKHTRKQLAGNSFEFEILVPDDEQSLSHRLHSLSGWCQGFLFGLGAMGHDEFEKLSEETKEVLHDLTEIVQIDSNVTDPHEDDEKQFMELVEYTRMAAIMIFCELSGRATNVVPHMQSRQVH